MMDLAETIKFTKTQILLARKYRHQKDVVNVVLEDGQLYSLKEVDRLINRFMKKEVK